MTKGNCAIWVIVFGKNQFLTLVINSNKVNPFLQEIEKKITSQNQSQNQNQNQNENQQFKERRKLTFISKARQKKETELSATEQEEIKSIISEYLRMIFTSEKLIPIQTSNLDTLFNTSFGRSYFCKSVFQSKFKEYQGHCLAKESFEDLNKLLFGALLVLSNLEENPLTFEQARLVTKSSYFYYK